MGDLRLDRTIQVYFMESERRIVVGSEQEGRKKREGTGKRKKTGKGEEGGRMAGQRVLWERQDIRELTNGGRKHTSSNTMSQLGTSPNDEQA